MTEEKQEDFVNVETSDKHSKDSDVDSIYKESKPGRDSAASLWYGPIKAGSLRGSIVSVIGSTIGSGLLSFPYAFSKLGLIPACLLLLFVASCSCWTLHLILLAGLKTKIMSYGDLLTKVLGKKVQTIYSLCSVIILSGCIMSYMVSAYEMIEQFIQQIFNYNLVPYKKYLYSGCCLFFQIPLCLLRDLSKLQFASMIAFIMFIMTNLIVICEAPFFYIQNKSNRIHFELFKPFDLFSYIESAAIFMFSFINHNAILEIVGSMNKPTLSRSKKVVNGSWLIILGFYYTMGIAGYISKSDSTPPIFITRDDLTSFSPDYFIIVSRLVISLSLFCLIPLRWKIFRENIRNLLSYETLPIQLDFMMTVIGMLLLNILVYNTNVITVLGVIGGIFTVVICFGIPLMDFVYTFRKKRDRIKGYLGFVILAIFVVVGTVSSVTSILDTFK